jgi:hypothetical protein
MGTFISLDLVSLKDANRKVGKVLVEIAIHGSLLESIDIKWRDRRKRKHLDYIGIPFCCNHSHFTSHLCRDYKGSEEVEELDEELAN